MTDQDNLPSLDALQDKISGASKEDPLRNDAADAEKEGGRPSAMRGPADLIAGIAVGGFLGYQLDIWLGTKPALVIIGIFLGMAGGVMNIYRATLVSQDQDDGETEE